MTERRRNATDPLDGKIAFISGAARGIGAPTARLMIEAGAKVAIGDVLDERGRETARTIAGPWLPASKSATVLSLHVGFTWRRARARSHTVLNRTAAARARATFRHGALVDRRDGYAHKIENSDHKQPNYDRLGEQENPTRRPTARTQ